jgi:hypothetical protein
MLAGPVALLVIAIAALVAVLGSSAGGPAVIGGVDRGVDEPRLDGEGLEPSAALANTAERAESERAVLDTDRDGSDPTTADVPTIPWPKDGIDLAVVDAGTGEPVPRALVRFVDPRERAPGDVDPSTSSDRPLDERLNEGGVSVRCDSKGRARVPYRTDDVLVEAEHRRGYARLWRARGSEPHVVQVHDLVSYDVRVVDGHGEPVPGARVVLEDLIPPIDRVLEERRSDADGWVRFDAAVSLRAPSAALVGVFGTPVRIYFSEASRTLVLPPHGSVSVVLDDPRLKNGIACALAPSQKSIAVGSRARAPVAHGVAEFDTVELGLRLEARADLLGVNKDSNTFIGPRSEGEHVRFEFEGLETVGWMRGVVEDEHGRAVRSMRLEIAPFGEPFGLSMQSRTLTTDADGGFEIALPFSLRNGGRVVFRDPVGTGRSAYVELPDFGEGRTADVGTVVLRRDVERIRGVVLGYGGPVSGASVTAAYSVPVDRTVDERVGRIGLQLITETGFTPEPGHFIATDATVVTGEDGRFETVAPPGATAVILVVSHGRHRGSKPVVALPAGDLRVVLEPDPVLVGRAVVPATWPQSGALAIVSPDATTERVRFDDSKAAAHYTAQAWLHGDPFLLRAPSFEPVGLELWSEPAGRAIADLGRYAPSLDKELAHAELDPLDLARFVRLVDVAIEPPRTDSSSRPSLVVWIEDADGEVWWGSAGATTGPWDARVLLPIDHAGDLIVKSDRCRFVPVPSGVERHAVELELGPPVVLRLESLAQLPDGVRLAFELVAGDRTRELRPDDDGLVREHLAGPGPVKLRMTTHVPRLAEGEVRDPRWDRLDGYPLVLAAFDVGDEGVELDVAVPDLAGLMQLFDDAH